VHRELSRRASGCLENLVIVANRVAAEFNGARDTCVLTSFALHDVLRRLGYNSRPLRIEAAVFLEYSPPAIRFVHRTPPGATHGNKRAD
jgi:hypothetical protein